jgi:hypothetical protein
MVEALPLATVGQARLKDGKVQYNVVETPQMSKDAQMSVQAIQIGAWASINHEDRFGPLTQINPIVELPFTAHDLRRGSAVVWN